MKTRVISAIVGILVLLAGLAAFNTPVLNVALFAISCLAVFEMARAVLGNYKWPMAVLGFVLCGVGCFYNYLAPHIGYTPLLLVLVLYWICALSVSVFCFTALPFGDVATVAIETINIAFAFGLIPYLRTTLGDHSLIVLIFALCCAWVADTGAYFTGRAFGKHKLAPHVSPKKTVEGLVGGMLTCAVVVVGIGLGYSAYHGSGVSVNFVALAVNALIASLAGVMGDLVASAIKRRHNIKDYGNIMPGHGGVMDRFDSVLYTLPVVVVFNMCFPIFG